MPICLIKYMVDCAVPIYLRLKEAESRQIVQLSFSYLQIDELQSPFLVRLIGKTPELQEFQLISCTVAVDTLREVAVALGACADMRSLKLTNCDLTSSHCFSLSPGLYSLSKLTHLSLAGNAIGAEGLSMLLGGNYASVQGLGLRKCALTAAARLPLVSLLTKMESLETLDLAENSLGEECIIGLIWCFSRLTRLKAVNLAATGPGPSAAIVISAHLPPTLSHLDLSRNSLDNQSFVTLAAALQALHSFSCLRIKANPLTEDCLHSLAEKAAGVIPAIEADLGHVWMQSRGKCCRCGLYCLGFQDICQWLRRRPALVGYLKVRRLRFI